MDGHRATRFLLFGDTAQASPAPEVLRHPLRRPQAACLPSRRPLVTRPGCTPGLLIVWSNVVLGNLLPHDGKPLQTGVYVSFFPCLHPEQCACTKQVLCDCLLS